MAKSLTSSRRTGATFHSSVRIEEDLDWTSLVKGTLHQVKKPGSGCKKNGTTSPPKKWLYALGWRSGEHPRVDWNSFYIEIDEDVLARMNVNMCQRVAAMTLQRDTSMERAVIANATCSSHIGMGRFYRITNVPQDIYDLVTEDSPFSGLEALRG
jgi:hypothetical protein